jgi:hypothetical protein
MFGKVKIFRWVYFNYNNVLYCNRSPKRCLFLFLDKVYNFILTPTCSLLICPTTIFALSCLTMFREDHASWISSLRVFASPSVHASLIGISINILQRILFLNRVTLCFLLNMRGQVSSTTRLCLCLLSNTDTQFPLTRSENLMFCWLCIIVT